MWESWFGLTNQTMFVSDGQAKYDHVIRITPYQPISFQCKGQSTLYISLLAWPTFTINMLSRYGITIRTPDLGWLVKLFTRLRVHCPLHCWPGHFYNKYVKLITIPIYRTCSLNSRKCGSHASAIAGKRQSRYSGSCLYPTPQLQKLPASQSFLTTMPILILTQYQTFSGRYVNAIDEMKNYLYTNVPFIAQMHYQTVHGSVWARPQPNLLALEVQSTLRHGPHFKFFCMHCK